MRPNAFHVVPFFYFKGGQNGRDPVPGLIGAANQDLFGVTTAGGNNACAATSQHHVGCGIVYKLSQGGSILPQTIIHTFNGSDGANPAAPLSGNGGNASTVIFGTTSAGGKHGFGTVFRVVVNGARFSSLYSFAGGSDGANPVGALYVGANGNLYGTTSAGGGGTCTGGCGTVFKLSLSGSKWVETVLYRFKGGTDGWTPTAGLAQLKGAFYGTTLYGGDAKCTNGCGTIFRLVPSGGAYVKKSINVDGAAEGAYVRAGVTVDSNGAIYAMSENGGDDSCQTAGGEEGASGCGSIFKLTPKGEGEYTSTVLHTFKGGTDGALPNGGFTSYQGGLYASTIHGGSTANCAGAGLGCGTIFATNPYRVLYSFGTLPSGGTPAAALFYCVLSGELNGSTQAGGKYGFGTLFKIQ